MIPGTPNTVTEAVQRLVAEGYTSTFADRDSTDRSGSEHSHQPAELLIEQVFRFEGDSDPADEAIVIGVFCADCDERGVVVSAFGPDADPALMDRLRQL